MFLLEALSAPRDREISLDIRIYEHPQAQGMAVAGLGVEAVQCGRSLRAGPRL